MGNPSFSFKSVLLAASLFGFLDALLVFATALDPRPERTAVISLAALAVAVGAGTALWLAGRLTGQRRAARRACLLLPLALLTLRGSEREPGAQVHRAARACLGVALGLVALWIDRKHGEDGFATAALIVQTPAFAALALSEVHLHYPLEAVSGARLVASVVLAATFAVASHWRPWAAIALVALPTLIDTGLYALPVARKEALSARPPAPHVLLIVLDSVRGDVLSLDGPLSKFAQESLVFDKAVASSNYTFPSHLALFTGRLPHEVGGFGQHVPAEVPLLTERFRQRGYRTGAFVGNYGYLRHGSGFERGFELYQSRPDALYESLLAPLALRSPWFVPHWHRLGRHRRASNLFQDAAGFLANSRAQPAFVFVNLLDAHEYHSPWRAAVLARPDTWAQGLDLDLAEGTRAAYAIAVRDLEADLAAFLEELRRSGLLDESWVVVTSDHGESLGEHGLGFHGKGWHEPLLHVPLLVRPPRETRGGHFGRLVGLHDVFALLDQAPEGGRDVLTRWSDSVSPDARLLAVVQGSGRKGCLALTAVAYEGALKYVREGKRVRLFDLAADPGEQRPLELASQHDRVALLREAAASVPECTAPAPPDPAAFERLRALGYTR